MGRHRPAAARLPLLGEPSVQSSTEMAAHSHGFTPANLDVDCVDFSPGKLCASESACFAVCSCGVTYQGSGTGVHRRRHGRWHSSAATACPAAFLPLGDFSGCQVPDAASHQVHPWGSSPLCYCRRRTGKTRRQWSSWQRSTSCTSSPPEDFSAEAAAEAAAGRRRCAKRLGFPESRRWPATVLSGGRRAIFLSGAGRMF